MRPLSKTVQEWDFKKTNRKLPDESFYFVITELQNGRDLWRSSCRTTHSSRVIQSRFPRTIYRQLSNIIQGWRLATCSLGNLCLWSIILTVEKYFLIFLTQTNYMTQSILLFLCFICLKMPATIQFISNIIAGFSYLSLTAQVSNSLFKKLNLKTTLKKWFHFQDRQQAKRIETDTICRAEQLKSFLD